MYFKLLKMSILSQIDYWYKKGFSNIFFYERPDTPDGTTLSKFVEADIEVKVGEIKWIFLIRALFHSKTTWPLLKIYTGNINSICIVEIPYIIEIQHGLLDDSYFNGRKPSLFLARSKESAYIYRMLRPTIKVIEISNDLKMPCLLPSKSMNFTSVEFYSKNPEGGISLEDLRKMEIELVNLIPTLRLHLHPRDSLLKLIIRSRFNLKITRCYLRTILFNKDCGSRLIISSYSSALFDRVVSGDFVLNLKSQQPPSLIQEKVYGCLPTYSIKEVKMVIKGERNVAKIV